MFGQYRRCSKRNNAEAVAVITYFDSFAIKAKQFFPRYSYGKGSTPTLQYQMKWMGCILSLFLCQFTSAQINSGTIVAFQLIDEKLIMAADSRGLLKGVPSDTHCKIAAFRHKMIVAVAGNAASVKLPGWSAWDATKEARYAIAHTSFRKQQTAEGLVNAVADDWVVRMKRHWEKDLRQHPDVIKEIAERNHSSLTNGIFAAAMHGTIAITPRTVRLTNGIIDFIIPINAEECTTPCAVGETDVFTEYIVGKTPRSANEKWSASPVERIVRLVELMGTYEQPNASGIIEVGGPTDALELWKDGSIHWIRKKCNCPDNQD
jgi:hypothetical protein